MTKPANLTIVDESMLLLTFSDCKVLVNTEDNHYKFWTYRVNRLDHKVEYFWGRIGKTTQSMETTPGSDWYINSEVETKVREKLKKGYRVLQ